MATDGEEVYPNVQRNDWFHHHDYTLWLNDRTQMRLSPAQYACLKSSMDKIAELESPVADSTSFILPDDGTEFRGPRHPLDMD